MVRRYRSAFVAAAVLSMVLVVATALSTWQASRAARAERLATQTIESLVDVFSQADPFGSASAEFSADEAVRHATVIATSKLSMYPKVQARLLYSLGQIQRRREKHAAAILLLQQALARLDIESAADRSPAILCMIEQAGALRGLGRLQEAKTLLFDAKRVAASHGMRDLIARVDLELGYTELNLSDLRAARQYFERVVQFQGVVGGTQIDSYAHYGLASIAMWEDDFHSAEIHLKAALTLAPSWKRDLHPAGVLTEMALAEALLRQGNYAAAEPKLHRALKNHIKLYGENSERTTAALSLLSELKRAQLQFEEAVTYARRALMSQIAADPEGRLDIAYVRNVLASALIDSGAFAEAEAEARSALDAFEHHLPGHHQYIASSEHILAEALLGQARAGEAEQMFISAMVNWAKGGAPEWRWARSASGLGEAARLQHRMSQAASLLEFSFDALRTAGGVDVSSLRRAEQRVSALRKSQSAAPAPHSRSTSTSIAADLAGFDANQSADRRVRAE